MSAFGLPARDERDWLKSDLNEGCSVLAFPLFSVFRGQARSFGESMSDWIFWSRSIVELGNSGTECFRRRNEYVGGLGNIRESRAREECKISLLVESKRVRRSPRNKWPLQVSARVDPAQRPGINPRGNLIINDPTPFIVFRAASKISETALLRIVHSAA